MKVKNTHILSLLASSVMAMSISLPVLAADGIAVSNKTFDGEWPLTIEKGNIHCLESGEILFEADGYSYAMNEASMLVAEENSYRSGLYIIKKLESIHKVIEVVTMNDRNLPEYDALSAIGIDVEAVLMEFNALCK